jgi:hypothetical protein
MASPSNTTDNKSKEKLYSRQSKQQQQQHHQSKQSQMSPGSPTTSASTTHSKPTTSTFFSLFACCFGCQADIIAIYKVIFVITVEIYFLWNFVESGIQRCTEENSMHNSDAFGTAAVTYCELKTNFVNFYSLFLTLTPYLLFIILPDVPILSIWSCLAFMVVGQAVMIIYLSCHGAWLTLVVYTIFILAIIVDGQVQKVLLFLATRKLGGILEENERNALHNHAQEMRHMIANVAHDLKTVSQYFYYFSVSQFIFTDCFFFFSSHFVLS